MTRVTETIMVTLRMESNTKYGQEERGNLVSGDILEPSHWPCPDYFKTPLCTGKRSPLTYLSTSIVNLCYSANY